MGHNQDSNTSEGYQTFEHYSQIERSAQHPALLSIMAEEGWISSDISISNSQQENNESSIQDVDALTYYLALRRSERKTAGVPPSRHGYYSDQECLV